jgi:hypothetical protein
MTFPSESMPQLFPQGEYRHFIWFYEKAEDDEPFTTTTVYAAVTSPLKESFG